MTVDSTKKIRVDNWILRAQVLERDLKVVSWAHAARGGDKRVRTKFPEVVYKQPRSGGQTYHAHKLCFWVFAQSRFDQRMRIIWITNYVEARVRQALFEMTSANKCAWAPASTETIVERLQNMSKQETKTNANNNNDNNNTCSNGMCSLPTKNAKNVEAKKKTSSCSSNNGGGCSNGNCSIEARNKSEEAVPELADIVSVQNAELDRQHRLCADALEQLRLKGDTSSLKEVLRCYKMHFEYEENLLDVHLYKDIIGEKNQSNGFSAADGARKSHYRDHERLISDIEKILSNIECNEEDNNPCLSSKFISEVLRNFERHANVYDDSYADALSTALQ